MNHFGNPTRRSVAALLLALACLGGAPAGVLAQPSLPEAMTTTKTALSPGDVSAIEAFIEANKAGLNGDADAIRVARTAILKPLQGTPSLNFRLAYAAALRPVLEQLIATGRPATVINALRIAGEAGATGTVAILFGQLDAAKEVPSAIRVAAVVGVSRLFEVTAKLDSAVDPAVLKTAVGLLSTVAETLNDPNVADAGIRALGMGLRIPAEKAGPTLHADIVKALASAGSTRAKAIKDLETAAYMPAVLRVAAILREVVTDDAGKNKQLDPAIYRDVAAYAGDLAVAIVRLRTVTGIDESMMGQASGAAGTIVVLSNTLIDKAAKQLPPPANVDLLIGPSGWLTKPPFNFKNDRFIP